MKIWHQYPFIRLIIPFVIGISVAIKNDQPFHLPLFILPTIFFIYFTTVLLFKKKRNYSFRWISGVLIYLFLLAAGFELTLLRTPKFNSSNISKIDDQSNFLMVQVTEPISERQQTFKIVAKLIGYHDTLSWKQCSGKLILYFEKDSLVQFVQYGDQLFVHSQLNEVGSPKNPEEFNYKKYLSNKGIYNQAYVKAENWEILARNKGNPIKSIGLLLREKFIKILQSNQIKGKEFAVASAILLGLDDYLEAEHQKEFAGAGAMHILCVSGLHVGIIYIILNNLLLFLNKRRGGKILKVFLLLTLIWFYALITGFSPSVLRATTMFSFVILGGLIQRKVNIYNSLATSAFFLLIIDPYIITQVGFQLSYLAVFGIVWLYQPIYQLFIPDNWILDKIWQITVVSIAATLATFPLSIYYFHQFPNLFLITNLIAIPSAMLIIYTGILVLLTSFIPIISLVVSKLLISILWFLNSSVKLIEGLSFSTTHGIFINELELIGLVLLLFSLSYLLIEKKKNYLFISLGLMIILVISINFRSYKNVHQQKIIVYNINKATALEFLGNKKSILLTDSSFQQDPSNIDYHIMNNWIRNGSNSHADIHLMTTDFEMDNLYKKENFIQFFDKTMLLVNGDLKLLPLKTKLDVDYLFLTHSTNLDMEDLMRYIDFEILIIDSSNPNWKIQQWVELCETNSLKYHVTKENGAWECQIKNNS